MSTVTDTLDSAGRTARAPARPEPHPGTGVAPRLAAVLAPVLRGDLPVRLRAWDGSTAGPLDAPTVLLNSPLGLRRLLFHPNELGLAQAYVTGEIDVEGDLLDGFRRVWTAVRDRRLTGRMSPSAMLRAVRTGIDLGIVGRPPAPPVTQARLRGRLHSKRRDREVIAHHYDLSNTFYDLILDENKAYSCGYWTDADTADQRDAERSDPDYTGSEAQKDKLDLICAKLGLAPGMKMLDVGCGWGSLTVHAAKNFGVTVLGVTLSEQQRQFVQQRIDDNGLGDRAEVALLDYREVPDGSYDAISAIEMGEHVGQANYPAFVAGLRDKLRPLGRVLIQQMSRRDNPGGGPFIEAFIAPDMTMRPVGQTVEMLEVAGLEVRDVHVMREHYVRTILEWYRTFEDNWDKAVSMVGAENARVWRLYMVGAAMSFEEGRMGVDQILAVKPSADGRSGMPATRVGW